MTDVALNTRALQVLKTLIERYILEGYPVGSKTLAEEGVLGLSPATIRNILADLESEGYLASPHTSAGRIPTALGYRIFVNNLLTVKPLKSSELQTLKENLNPDLDMAHLLQSASLILSSLTKLAGVVALPRRNRIALRQVEFLPLSKNRVLVILILNNREVQNRIIYTDKTYSSSELQAAANYLTDHYAGKSLLSIRDELSAALREDKQHMADLLQAAMDMGNKIFTSNSQTKDYVIAGQSNLLKYTDLNIDHWRNLFEAFNQKQEILNLLEHALKAEGIQIFIGKESGYEIFGQCSIVTASYSVAGEFVGSLGVIGPTRMCYERVIPAVDVTAKILSAALNNN